MQTEFIAVPPFWSVGQTIDFMRDAEDLPETFYEIFVVDPGHRLLGAVPLDRLLRAKRPVAVEDVMRDDDHRVRATDDQEEAARLFQRYNLVSAAVVDEGGRLVGTLMVDDIVDVLDEEADADLKALGGVKPEEEISDDVLDTAKSRFPWLFANAITAVISASVIRFFEGSVEQMVALAVLMPIVASMGGNAGTQTMTVTVRALATRQLSRANTWRIVRRELVVGLINGVAVRPHHRARRGDLVRDHGSRLRDRAVASRRALGRGLRRHPDPASPQPARGRPRRLLRPLRHDHHRHRRLPRLPRHRHAVVRAVSRGWTVNE